MNGPKIWREVGHRVGATLCGRGFGVSVSAQLPCLLGVGVVAALDYWLGDAPWWFIPMLAGMLLGGVEIVVAKEQERGESRFGRRAEELDDLARICARPSHVSAEDSLLAAAQAVVERWDTPLWKDAPATAGYINALRAAVDARLERGAK